jgi:type 2 lantibiotic biosynthesis protein LanM
MRALGLRERGEQFASLDARRVPIEADFLLSHWRNTLALRPLENWKHFLAANGLTEADFLSVLEDDDAMSSESQPLWVQRVLKLCKMASTNTSRPIALDDLCAFIEPFLSDAQHSVALMARRLNASGGRKLIGPSVVRGLSGRLKDDLLELVLRPALLEAEIESHTSGPKSEGELETFSHYMRRLGYPEERLKLCVQYPGLARNMLFMCDRWREAVTEFLSRVISDQDRLCELFGVEHSGHLTFARFSDGDAHHGGRRVVVVHFKGGQRVVYKPRPLDAFARFQRLLEWLNSKGYEPRLKALKALPRGDYGWLEFVDSTACTDRAQVEAFYQRIGAIVALLRLVGATDGHFENLIASGEHPHLVDVETLLTPEYREIDALSADGFVQQSIHESVFALGLLPNPTLVNGRLVDLSGIGAHSHQDTPLETMALINDECGKPRVANKIYRTGRTYNRPRIGRRTVSPTAYVEAIEKGHREAYNLLLRERAELASDRGPLKDFSDAQVRVVLRPTAVYSNLLRESYHPTALYDGCERDRVLAQLWLGSDVRSELRATVESEYRQTLDGDIPYFWARPAEKAVYAPSGETAMFYGRFSGLDAANKRLDCMGPADLSLQTALIWESLGALQENPKFVPLTSSKMRTPVVPDLSALAVEIGRKIAVAAFRKDGAASWLGPRAAEHACCDRLGEAPFRIISTDLYEGLLGVALFLGYLYRASGDHLFAALAREALVTARSRVERGELRHRIGAFDGISGYIYVLAHLAKLFGDVQLVHEATRATQDLMHAEAREPALDLTTGIAGAILSLLALDAVAPASPALSVARQLADRLERRFSYVTPNSLPLHYSRGASHGMTGIAWAFAALDSRLGRSSSAGTRRAIETDLTLTADGDWIDAGDDYHTNQATWCHGAPGIALCRLAIYRAIGDTSLSAGVASAMKATLSSSKRPIFDLGLCHGHLGIVETYLFASSILQPAESWRHIVQAVIATRSSDLNLIQQPTIGIQHPGLMMGFSGIGFELLRILDPISVPSILLLESPR